MGSWMVSRHPTTWSGYRSACQPSYSRELEKSWAFGQGPELFCFGLLKEFDIEHLAALVAPRPVTFADPG